MRLSRLNLPHLFFLSPCPAHCTFSKYVGRSQKLDTSGSCRTTEAAMSDCSASCVLLFQTLLHLSAHTPTWWRLFLLRYFLKVQIFLKDISSLALYHHHCLDLSNALLHGHELLHEVQCSFFCKLSSQQSFHNHHPTLTSISYFSYFLISLIRFFNISITNIAL